MPLHTWHKIDEHLRLMGVTHGTRVVHTHMVAQRKDRTHLARENKDGVKKYGTQGNTQSNASRGHVPSGGR